MNKILTSVWPVLAGRSSFRWCSWLPLISIHEWPALVWTATVDHVLDRLSDEGRRQLVSLADLMQPVGAPRDGLPTTT